MSHFTVYVLLRGDVTEDAVSAALQPYHEFECTGVKDEFVVFVDHDDEIRKEWGEKTEERWVGTSGTHYAAYDNRFYRDPTREESNTIGRMAGTGCGHGMVWSSRDWDDGQGYRTKIHVDPASLGFAKINVPISTLYEAIGEYAREEHGYGMHEGRFGRWTNPNKRWDWWTVGGRWHGNINGRRDPETDNNWPAPKRSGKDDGLTANSRPVAELIPLAASNDDIAFPLALLLPEAVGGRQWHERGEMGWWGVVHDEQTADTWRPQVAALYGQFKDCTAVAVDCHI